MEDVSWDDLLPELRGLFRLSLPTRDRLRLKQVNKMMYTEDDEYPPRFPAPVMELMNQAHQWSDEKGSDYFCRYIEQWLDIVNGKSPWIEWLNQFTYCSLEKDKYGIASLPPLPMDKTYITSQKWTWKSPEVNHSLRVEIHIPCPNQSEERHLIVICCRTLSIQSSQEWSLYCYLCKSCCGY